MQNAIFLLSQTNLPLLYVQKKNLQLFVIKGIETLFITLQTFCFGFFWTVQRLTCLSTSDYCIAAELRCVWA